MGCPVRGKLPYTCTTLSYVRSRHDFLVAFSTIIAPHDHRKTSLYTLQLLLTRLSYFLTLNHLSEFRNHTGHRNHHCSPASFNRNLDSPLASAPALIIESASSHGNRFSITPSSSSSVSTIRNNFALCRQCYQLHAKD